MADAIVSSLAQTIIESLSAAVIQEISLAWGLTDEINNLKSIFGTIQLVLKDAELKQRKNEAIQDWLRKLKNAAYDADNILDQIATEGLQRRLDSERGTQHKLKSYLSSQNPLIFRFKMAHKVQNVRKTLDAIAKERLQFHLSEDVVGKRFGETLESRFMTSSLVNELEIFGRKKEKKKIIDELCDIRREQDDLSVYAIWGMGGLGKTTLTQMVYNDQRTKNHFELRVWVCVSEDFSIQKLVREIIESIEGHGCNVTGLDPLQHLLQEKLSGQKFLLVLDDVWNENHRLWDELKEVLRCGSKGSMLMVTTRIEKVAIMMATISPRKIACLSENDSWSLFKRRAFTTGEEENLVAIGKRIVKKCGEVPLAINALGSLMRFKSDEREWLAILESEIWNLSDGENSILPALRLSYDNLLPKMRQCFAYCCIFPKDHRMEENQLIQLWTANGFISSEGESDMWLTGHLIFKELVWRSFIQDVKINNKGKRTCKIHDLMHDLALSVMQHENYIMEHDKVPKIPKMLHHLCFDVKLSSVAPENKIKLPIDDSLRSFIVHKGHYPLFTEEFFSFLSKQQYMRVLDMHIKTIDQKLPSFVCKLKHLRYLSVSCYKLKKLPDSLTCLLNLQTLKLTYSRDLLELPNDLKVMNNLWFIELEKYDSLLCTPPGLRYLTCLRGLSIFIVGQDESQRIDQLKELNLGGELTIRGLENMRNLEEAKSANLIRKKDMTSLTLSWSNDILENSLGYFEEVLEGLQPHQNLEKIYIQSYRGSRFPNWMSGLALMNLTDISLENCGIELLPPLGKLPSLVCLLLKGMDRIKHLGTEWHGDVESSFPALKTLTIERMPNLEEWIIPDSLERFPCLHRLKINVCPKLKELSFLPYLRNLEIRNSSVTLVGSIASLTLLRSLSLSNFTDLDVLPIGLLQNYTSLKHLQITALPIRTLSNMLDNLSALRSLNLYRCPNLEFLPDGLQFLDSLENLRIVSCDSIKSFPASTLESLSSLRMLSLRNCKKLKPLSGALERERRSCNI